MIFSLLLYIRKILNIFNNLYIISIFFFRREMFKTNISFTVKVHTFTAHLQIVILKGVFFPYNFFVCLVDTN